METPEEIFVIMLERDLDDHTAAESPDWKPQRMIPDTPEDNFSFKAAHALKRRWAGHGEIKIGRVTFDDLDQIIPARAANDLLLPDNTKLDELIGLMHEVASEHGHGLPLGQECHLAQMRLEILRWVRNL